MNIGIRASSGEFLLLLNEDAYLDTKYISTGIQRFRGDSRIGWVGGNVLAIDDGVRTERIISGAYSLKRRFQLVSIEPSSKDEKVLMVNNCSMFLRRVALDEILDGHGWLDKE